MKTINLKRKILISLGIVIVSMSLLTYALYVFSRSMDARAEKIASTRALIDMRTRGLENLAELNRQAPLAAGYQQILDLLLPTQDQLLDFPRWVDGLARTYRLNVRATFEGNQSNPTEGAPGSAAFSLAIGGSYGEIMSFLKFLEVDSKRFLISFTKVELNRSDDMFNAKARGLVFYR